MVSSMLLPFPLPQTTSPRPLRCAELCAVCGDQSTGYHYEVPSCNGCKTFFRRTIVSERVFKCHKDGNCTFNKDVRCACRSCRFKKCLQVGMNPRAIQSSRTGFSTVPTPSTSASKETSPSTTPEPVTASTTSAASRKRAFDVCSLLDLPPSSSTTPPPEVPFFAKVNNIELTARLADLLTLEDKVESLRLASMEPPTILLDILTRPSALADTPKSSPVIITPVIDLDREMFALLEYAKAFNWFCHLNFSDKFALLCERTSALLVLRLAWNRAGTAFQDQLSLLLSPLVETIRQINVDKASLSLLSALLLSENSSFALSNSAKEELARERDINASCLASYLFQKHGSTGAAQVAQHFSLLWTSLKIADKLKDRVKATQPEHSLCRQLVDNAGHY